LARNRFLATAVSVLAAGALAWSGSWKQIWPIFGSANQLLAALALLAVSVWLAHRARRRLFVIIPMAIMYAVTASSLGLLTWRHLVQPGGSVVLGVAAALLLLVAMVLAGLAVRVTRKARSGAPG
jgi:carbon starvation protein